MFNISITRMSSKGQIVIPLEMRSNLKEGEKLAVIQNGSQLIIKKVVDLDENFEEDLEFAKRIETAYTEYEKGNFKTMEAEDFLKELKKW